LSHCAGVAGTAIRCNANLTRLSPRLDRATPRDDLETANIRGRVRILQGSSCLFQLFSFDMPTSRWIHGDTHEGYRDSITKPPCNCGCKDDKSSYAAKADASSEFKAQLRREADALLLKAQQQKTHNPLRLYSHTNCHPNHSSDIPIVPLDRKFRDPPDTPVSTHLTRLQVLTRLLQTDFFSPDTGTYPTAIDWTSTVLATHLINYSSQTHDHRYFSHLISFFHNQNVTGLLRQNYDDMLWVVLTFLRGAQYAAETEPEWVDPFLERANVFYELARSGWDELSCGGGMVWGRWARYKNAVTTELWITASVGMYEAFGEERMLEAAVDGWVWLKNSGMLNDEGLFNDGLDANCKYTLSPLLY
jgi:Glycosyl hydrolase family 76